MSYPNSKPRSSAINLETDEAESDLLKRWEVAARRQLETDGIFDQRGQILSEDNLPATLSLNAAVLLFLATLKGKSKETAKTYRAGCRRLMWFIHSSGRGEPDQQAVTALSPLVLEHFYLWLAENYGGQSRATVAGYLTAARNLFEYLASREITPGNCQYQKMIARLGKLQGRASYRTPSTLRIKGRQAQIERTAQAAVTKIADVVSNQDEAETSPRVPGMLKREEEALRQRLEMLRDRALILTLFTSGMRRQEAASLNRPELESLIAEYQSELCKVNAFSSEVKDQANKPEPAEANNSSGFSNTYELIITGKGQKERLVYFDSVTLDAVAEYLKLRGKDGFQPLFIQHHRGRDQVKPGSRGENYRISLVGVWRVVNNYARRLGLEIKPHDFRHNLATTLLNAGAQLSEVQDILGHSSPTTTKQIYAHYDQGHLKEAFAKFRRSASELD